MICRFLRQKLFTGTLSVDSPEKSCSQPIILSIFIAAAAQGHLFYEFLHEDESDIGGDRERHQWEQSGNDRCQ